MVDWIVSRQGEIEDQLGPFLNKKLYSIGWAVMHRGTILNDVMSVILAFYFKSITAHLSHLIPSFGMNHIFVCNYRSMQSQKKLNNDQKLVML